MTSAPPSPAEIILPEPYLAMDRLNSWLRSGLPWLCPVRSRLRPIVYWVKNKAILDASARLDWSIGLRRVMVDCKCRVCGGTGIYQAWYYIDEHDEEPCRTCGATGKVVLRFIETTIGPLRWHTPLARWLSASLDVYVPFAADGQWYQSEDWKPNQAGRPMEMADVERDALAILRQWPHEFCFIVDFHHRAGLEPHHNCPLIAKAEAWVRSIFAEAAGSIRIQS